MRSAAGGSSSNPDFQTIDNLNWQRRTGPCELWVAYACPMNERRDESMRSVGLCAACVNVRVVESAKGSVFVLCELSKTDARFSKYPRLPVLRCVGYSPKQT